MPISINQLSLTEQEFTPEDQEEPKSSFMIKPPSESLKTKLMFLSDQSQMFEAVELVIKKCLIGWNNVKDDKGQEVEFSEANKEFLPAPTRMDIFTNACRMASLEEDQKKT